MKSFAPAPLKPLIPLDTFRQLDLRIGTILAVEDLPHSKKLVRLAVDFGDHRRKILAGMKTERDDPAALAGCQALFLVNLQPKSIAGELSEGMLIDIGFDDGISPALAVPERPVPSGARAG